MRDRQILNRIPVLTAAVAVGLLLLAGAYTVVASPAASNLTADTANAGTFWASGWRPIAQGGTYTFNHNLGVPPEQLAVDLRFEDTDLGGIGINRANYGGLEVTGPPKTWHGAFWFNLTANGIKVKRMADDTAADRVSVKVWVVSPPDKDSGWQNIAQGGTYTFNHNIGVTPEDLTVSLWFSGTFQGGIHQYTYGGLTNGMSELGAYWWDLTSNSVKVSRRANDLSVEQVRVVVVQGDPPDYDSYVTLSGWQPIAQGTEFTFNHNLNWNPDMLLVRGECYDPGSAGINHISAGGEEQPGGSRGAHLQNITANSITFVRRANDQFCPQARVVIYKLSAQLYLPLTMNSYSQ